MFACHNTHSSCVMESIGNSKLPLRLDREACQLRFPPGLVPVLALICGVREFQNYSSRWKLSRQNFYNGKIHGYIEWTSILMADMSKSSRLRHVRSETKPKCEIACSSDAPADAASSRGIIKASVKVQHLIVKAIQQLCASGVLINRLLAHFIGDKRDRLMESRCVW